MTHVNSLALGQTKLYRLRFPCRLARFSRIGDGHGAAKTFGRPDDVRGGILLRDKMWSSRLRRRMRSTFGHGPTLNRPSRAIVRPHLQKNKGAAFCNLQGGRTCGAVKDGWGRACARNSFASRRRRRESLSSRRECRIERRRASQRFSRRKRICIFEPVITRR